MRFEDIKSILLTLLVIMSLVLTWSLWTYQPEYDQIESTSYLKDVEIGIEKEIADIVFPKMILFHKNDRHYGTTDGSEVKKILSYINQWNFTNFTDVSPSVQDGFLDFVHGRNSVEVVFPVEIPIETLKEVFPIEEEELRSLGFDRILIPIVDTQKEEPIAYFLSYDNHYVYKATIHNFLYETFNKEIYQTSIKYTKYMAYKIDSFTSLFLPEGRIKVNRVTYYSLNISGEDFKDALFSNPNYVKREIQANGDETYTDGARALDLLQGGSLLSFVNPSIQLDDQSFSSSQLLQKSIDFVNDHNGWTDNYYLYDWNADLQSTEFRLHINGLPVFNYAGLSKIAQEWDKTSMFDKYDRPLFKLQLSIESESSQVELPSGYTLIEFLKKTPSFDPTKLEDAVIGYELVKDRSSARVTVQPTWAIYYNGVWRKIMFDEVRELGGTILGLE